MNPQEKDHNQDQEQEQEYEYDSMSSAPSTPKNSEGNGEKKKKSRGLKKLFTRKKSDVLDKSPSLSGRGLAGDEGVGSESRRRSLTNFLKRGGRTPKKDDGKSSSSSETSPEKKEPHAKDNWVDASNEDTKPKPSKLHTLAEKLGEEAHHLIEKAIGDTKKQPEPSPTEAKVDDKGKAKEHQEPEFKHDHHHHHEQNEHPHNDVKEENIVATESETVKDEARDMVSPPPLHDKECFGCESLAKGLQHVCLPWTVKKEDH